MYDLPSPSLYKLLSKVLKTTTTTAAKKGDKGATRLISITPYTLYLPLYLTLPPHAVASRRCLNEFSVYGAYSICFHYHYTHTHTLHVAVNLLG